MKNENGISLIVILVIIAVVAIGGVTTVVVMNQNNSGTSEVENLAQSSVVSNTVEEEEDLETEEAPGIRKNGSFPNDTDEITLEEKNYYKNKMVKALIALDIDILELYLEEDSYRYVKSIYDDPEYKELYQNTIGEIIYLEESTIFVSKDLDYVYSRWYDEHYKANLNIVDSVRELSKEEVNSVYEKYYKTAPYTAGDVGGVSISVKDGYIKYGISKLFEYIHVDLFMDLDPTFTVDGENYANFVFGSDRENMNLGYDYINRDGDFDIWESTYNFDIDEMISVFEGDPETFKMDLYKKCLEEYYKNAENRKIIEDWVKENAEVYRDLSYVTFFVPATVEDYPFTLIETEEEKELIKDLNLGESFRTSESSPWEVFYEIVSKLKKEGLLK